MATFPHLAVPANPWKKNHTFFMSGEAPSSNAESLPSWKETLLLNVEKADLMPEDDAALKKAIREFKPSATEPKEKFELEMKYAIDRKEKSKDATADKFGDIVVEVATLNNPLTFLENASGKALSKDVADSELEQGKELTVDFGIGNPAVNQLQAKEAQRRIGLHHMLMNEPQITKVEVTNTSGASTVLIRCPDGKYRAEGRLTEKKHYTVYQGYKVKVLEVGGRDEANKMDGTAAELAQDKTMQSAAEARLEGAQRTEAASASAEVAAKDKADHAAALELAGVYGRPGAVAARIEGSPEEAADEAQLKKGVLTLTDELFREGKEAKLTSGIEEELKGKIFLSINYKEKEGEPQEITLKLVDPEGNVHVYKGVSNQPVGVNAFVNNTLPPIVEGQTRMKSYQWNRDAFKDLIKNIADHKGTKPGETAPRPASAPAAAPSASSAANTSGSETVASSPYDIGDRFGSVHAAGTNGEEGGAIEANRTDVVGPLKYKEGVRLPDAMKGWTIRDFEANKYRVDHMDQFLDSLQTLAKQAGRSEMELLRPFLDGNKITYQELCHQVYGRTPQKVWEDYSELRAATEGQTDDSKLTSIKKKENLGEKKDEYYTVGEAKQMMKQKGYEEFFVASYRLLESARLLETNKTEKVEGATFESGSPEDAKKLIATLFDPTDAAPLSKRTLFRWNQSEMSMDGTGLDYVMKGENRYEATISSSAAYALLLQEFTRGNEVDYQGLAARLTEMRTAGMLFYDAMAEKDQNKMSQSYGKEWGIDPKSVRGKLEDASKQPALDAEKLKGDKPFTKEDILLIQLGMIPEAKRHEVNDASAVERQKLREMDEGARQKVAESVQGLARAYKEKTGTALTSEEIKALEKEVLSKLVIREGRGTFGIGLADITNDGSMDLGLGYGHELVRVPIGEKGFLTINAGVGVGLSFVDKLSVCQVGVGASATLGRTFGKQDQNSAAVTVGASVSLLDLNASVGAMAGMRLKAKNNPDSEKINERARVWYFGFGAGAAAGIGLESGGASVKFAYVEIGRDLDAVAQRKFLRLIEENPEFEKELNDYVLKNLDNYRAQIEEQTAGMSELEKNQYIHSIGLMIAELYIRERGNEAVSDMCAIQFRKIGGGVGIGNAGFAFLYGGVSLKGGQIARYFKTSNAEDMDEIAQAKLLEQDAAEHHSPAGEVVYLSGNLTMTESGERSIENSLNKFEQAGNLETINAQLRKQNMELVPNASDPTKLRLKVSNVDGYVNIYVDPASGVEVARGADGFGYLNLDYHDALSILRVDKTTAFRQGDGGVKNVDIYITNNPSKSIRDIKDQSGDRLTWRQTDIYPADSGKNVLETTMHVKRNAYTETSSIYKNEADLLTAVGADGLGDLNRVDAQTAREALQKRIAVILEQANEGTDAPRIEKLDSYISTLIKSKSVSYALLTTDVAYTKSILDGAKTKLDNKLSNEEATYLLQYLLVDSRAKMPGSPEALKKHILGWNTAALSNFCAQHGVDTGVSALIMNEYGETLTNLGGADLPSQSLEEGYAFHTLIGPNATGELGRGINSRFASKLAGTEAVTVDNLTSKFGLSPEQAQAFIDAQLREFRHLSNVSSENADPMVRVRSPLGMQILEQAPHLFSTEIAEGLVAAVEAKTINKEAPYWKIFADALTQLETKGTYISPSGYVLSREYDMKMGFLESCRNFSVAYKEKTMTLKRGAVAGTNVYQGVDSGLGNNFTNAAAAVAVPLKGKPEGEKEGDGSLQSDKGDGESDQGGDGAHDDDEAPPENMFE